MNNVLKKFSGKTILITGGTGSFGTTIAKRMLNSDIKQIRIFSRDEKKQEDMRIHFQDSRLKFYIGDVRSQNSIFAAMRGVDYVFSAAALKQVPSCEFYPLEAVATNIMGTENTLEAAVHNGVKNVVVLSTDKAVCPINAMGMSKALMEKVAIAKTRNLESNDITINVTRYGNVMASRGSVIPHFLNQITSGKPITVTDPDMTRFMMTLDDAVDLVLFAFTKGKSGDTFVQKAPAATIMQLANAMKDLLHSGSEIRIIGTRHGEKKHEALLSREEMAVAEDMGDYYRIPSDTRDLNYSLYFDEGKKMSPYSEYTSENTRRLTDDELKQMLRTIPMVAQAIDQAK
jgi:UDP-N-acetylglucosamine 4,6-dehydratase/5-epimerase